MNLGLGYGRNGWEVGAYHNSEYGVTGYLSKGLWKYQFNDTVSIGVAGMVAIGYENSPVIAGPVPTLQVGKMRFLFTHSVVGLSLEW